VLRALSRIAVSVLCLFVFCAVGGASFAQGQPPQGRPAPGQITQPTPTASDTRMGMWRGRPVTYQVINGRNIYEGDIILENVQPMPKAGQGGGVHSDSVGLVNSNHLWPMLLPAVAISLSVWDISVSTRTQSPASQCSIARSH